MKGWFRATPPEDASTFSMHRHAHAGLVAAIVTFLILVESAVGHVLLARTSVLLAWLATTSSLSVGLWLVGDVQATRRSPLRLGATGLHVAVGRRLRIFVPYAEIALGGHGGKLVRATPLGTASNVAVGFRRPLVLLGPLGRGRSCDGLRLHVDRPDEFIAALRARVTG